MKKITISSEFKIYQNKADLDSAVINLIEKAKQAREKAYAPYSNFYVGVALLLDNGKIVTGSNQENASYPSGLCAERTAVYYAGAKYPEAKIMKMAIIAGSIKSTTSKPIPPCGACRQALIEYEIKQKQPIEAFFMGAVGDIMYSHSIANLLPLVFDKTAL